MVNRTASYSGAAVWNRQGHLHRRVISVRTRLIGCIQTQLSSVSPNMNSRLFGSVRTAITVGIYIIHHRSRLIDTTFYMFRQSQWRPSRYPSHLFMVSSIGIRYRIHTYHMISFGNKMEKKTYSRISTRTSLLFPAKPHHRVFLLVSQP